MPAVRPRIVLIALACAAFVFSPSSQGQAPPVLTATVGPAFTISLRDASGARVTHLDRGAYTINVSDLGDIHNFHLFGQGVNQATEVESTGTFTWTVTFQDAIYTYQCDPHLTTMRGRFAVGTASLPTPPPPAAAPVRLSGKVGPGATIRLNNSAGRRATRVKAGRYRITVQDVSKAQNFHLTGPGVNRKTGVSFRGTTTWTLTLRAGIYRYKSDASKNAKGTLVVTAATSTHAGHA